MNRAVIILNPASRNALAVERLHQAGLALHSDGWEVEVRATEGPGHATRLAAEAALVGTNVVFACGGDGTVNEVINGLAGSDSALGLIRGGMGNVFAKEIGVARNPERALRVLLDGDRRRFDLGVAGGRYFLLMAGVGFDASVVKRVPSGAKRFLGSSSYALWGALELLRYKPVHAELVLNGETREQELYWLLLGNTRSYGGVIDITSRARADDGVLDSYTFAGNGLSWAVASTLRLLMGRADRAGGVHFQTLQELEVVTPGLPVQADGEYLGLTPMRFTVAPQSLDVLLPKGKGSRLLSSKS